MRKLSFTILIFSIISVAGYGQPGDYRELRAKTTVPPYSLDKIKLMIKNSIPKNAEIDESPENFVQGLPANIYKQLTIKEKFTYVMIYPETYAQNCSIFMPVPDEENKIFGCLISWMNEETWSDRQLDFLKKNKPGVMNLIKESVTRSKRMGVNYKDAIVTMDAWEMIPFIISYYKQNKKDRDVLTLLMLLMKNGHHDEFVNSQSYKKLYANEDNCETYINFNKANEDLIIKRAQNYYKQKNENPKRAG